LTCAFDFGTLRSDIRRDWRYCATVARGEPFFAFEAKAVKAFEVSVVEEKIEV